MDIRQSPLYDSFIKQLGWQVKRIGKWNIFIRNIPFFGRIAKIQKIKKPIPFDKIADFIVKEKISSLTIEPDEKNDDILIGQFLANEYKINKSPFLPTKTILIDLKPKEDEIFKRFSQAKRRAVRKAIKNKVKIFESSEVESFIKLKSKQFFPIGFLIAKEIRTLWNTFYPNHTTLLLAKHPPGVNVKHLEGVIGGVLLLFWEKKAYYWLAASTKESNKYAAPSLLVWETLKLSKKRGSTSFDFEGIYDSRFHTATKNWQGFTNFKQGFGGKEVTYIGSFKSTSLQDFCGIIRLYEH